MGLKGLSHISVCCDDEMLSCTDGGTTDKTGTATAIRDGDEDRLFDRLIFGVTEVDEVVERIMDIRRNRLPIFPLVSNASENDDDRRRWTFSAKAGF